MGASRSQASYLAGRSRALDAEQAGEFLLAWARRLAGKKYRQGLRRPAWSAPSGCAALHEIANYRIRCLPDGAARALFAWGHGFPVELFSRVLTPCEMLALQAQGRRGVSLVGEQAVSASHQSPFDFLIHDLCHLGKFIDPEHYYGQVGLFAKLHLILSTPAWQNIECDLDSIWQAEKNYVISDMNGSVLFLFASFKIRLKNAIRRFIAGKSPGHELGHELGHERLDAEFLRLCESILSTLFDLLELNGQVRNAAMAISARRDQPDLARILIEYFSSYGRRQVRDLGGVTPVAFDQADPDRAT